MTRATSTGVRVHARAPELIIRGAGVQASLRPDLGAKVTELLFGDKKRDWLWHNDRLPHRRGRPGASYERDFDSGGWDELFPTVLATRPGDVGGAWEGLGLTDHGEVWCRPWTVVDQGLSHCRTECAHAGPAFRLARHLTASVSTLRAEYELSNDGPRTMPYVWAAHPIFALEPGMALDVDPEAPIVVETINGVRPSNGHTPKRWGDLATLHTELTGALPFTAAALRSGLFAKVFVRNGGDRGVGLLDGRTGEAVRIVADPESAPYTAIWINLGAWAGDGGEPLTNVGIEPTSAPLDAPPRPGAESAEHVIEPGERRRWGFEIRHER